MNITDVKEVDTLRDHKTVNEILHSGKWILLNVANGTYPEDGMAYILFTVGRVLE